MAAGHQNSDDPLSLINRDSVRQNPLAGKVAEEQAGNPNLAFKGFLSHRPGFLLHGFQGHILLNAVRGHHDDAHPVRAHIGHGEEIVLPDHLVQKLRKFLPFRKPGASDQLCQALQKLDVRSELFMDPFLILVRFLPHVDADGLLQGIGKKIDKNTAAGQKQNAAADDHGNAFLQPFVDFSLAHRTLLSAPAALMMGSGFH